MRDFDKILAREPGVYFYARYVDDIILFTFQNPKEIAKRADALLEYETGLKLNKQKTKIIHRQCRCTVECSCAGTCRCNKHCRCQYDQTKDVFFEYLGYRFILPDIARDSKKMVITLSKNKVNKFKTRIILSFLDFIDNNDFTLLEKRIAFLTGNFRAIHRYSIILLRSSVLLMGLSKSSYTTE